MVDGKVDGKMDGKVEQEEIDDCCHRGRCEQDRKFELFLTLTAAMMG